MRRARFGWVAFATMLLTGCPESTTPDSGTMDSAVDTGARTDAGADTGADTGTGADAGDCPGGCDIGRSCCDGECVNMMNDPRHCGACATPCDAAGEFCQGGSCTDIPCTGGTCTGADNCCGDECCGAGEICCDPQGPIVTGPECTTPNDRGTCPQGCAPLCMCNSPDTPIATPEGDRPIAALSIGDLVFTINDGAIVAMPIVQTQTVPVTDHQVVRVVLDSGDVLEISATHPLADGGSIGALSAGDSLGALRVVEAETIPYVHGATHDILPGSDSGSYFAAGVRLDSTIAR